MKKISESKLKKAKETFFAFEMYSFDMGSHPNYESIYEHVSKLTNVPIENIKIWHESIQ